MKITLELEADDVHEWRWYKDTPFGVCHDMKYHNGLVFTLGQGAIYNDSTKLARSSIEAELINIDDKISKIIWMKKVIESQKFKMNLNIIYQDNTSTMRLVTNGKESSGKRKRHFDIKYFYITDLIDRKEVSIRHCSSNKMIADYFTKPLVGRKFVNMRKKRMNDA